VPAATGPGWVRAASRSSISCVTWKEKKSGRPSPLPSTVRCATLVAFSMLALALRFHLAVSMSCARNTESWMPSSRVIAVPKSPMKVGRPSPRLRYRLNGVLLVILT